METVEAQLVLLGYQQAYEVDSLSSDQALDAIRHSGLTLPPDYVEFLRVHPNTGLFECEAGHFDCDVSFVGPESRWAANGQYPVETITGLDDEQGPLFIPSWLLPGYYLPIASSLGDNCFVLDMRQASGGRVLFCFDGQYEESSLLPLADSFSAFVLGLRHIENEQPPPEKPGLFKRLFRKFSN